MSLKHVDQNLTQDHWGRLASGTVPGMAYFAGTGPLGTTCGGCRHCVLPEKSRTPYCGAAAKMAGKQTVGIRRKTASCKYFEPK